jgi:transcriptional regulator with XRE-family HTH domain
VRQYGARVGMTAAGEGLPMPSELLRLRTRRGFSQAALAMLVGKTEGAISRFERGERRPAPETIVKLAQALGVSATRLNTALRSDASVEAEPPDQAAS